MEPHAAHGIHLWRHGEVHHEPLTDAVHDEIRQWQSRPTVQAIWKAHGLSPHRWRHFKLSNDPAFAEKLTDIVGPCRGAVG